MESPRGMAPHPPGRGAALATSRSHSPTMPGDPASILSAARRIHHDSASPSVRQEALRVLQMEKRAKLLQAKRQRAADIEASRRQQLEQRAALAKRRMDDAEARAKANRERLRKQASSGTFSAEWEESRRLKAYELRDQRRRNLEERLRRSHRGAEARIRETMEQRDKTIGTRRIEKEEQISSAQQRKRRDYEEFERTMSTTTARRMAEGRAKVERAHRLRREHVDWVSQRHRSALDASSRRAQEAFEMRRQRYLSRIKEYNERMEQLDSQRRLVDRHRRSLHSYLEREKALGTSAHEHVYEPAISPMRSLWHSADTPVPHRLKGLGSQSPMNAVLPLATSRTAPPDPYTEH